MPNTIARLSLAALTATFAGCAGDVLLEPTAALPHVVRSEAEFSVGAAETEGALVAQLRQASVRFRDIQVARDEGYIQTSPGCVPGFGIVYRKNALLDGVVDPAHPEILLYEPQKNGRMQLVGVELLVLAGPWDATHSGPPTYAGQTFEDRRAPGSAGPPFPNYALHAWIWQHNPNGLFTPFNPTITCEFAR
jgi:hypothetical protein